jgi:hypothetical protein
MLSAIGSIASQGGAKTYANTGIPRSALTGNGGYGQSMVYSYDFQGDGNPADDPLYYITGIKNDGINLTLNIPTYIGKIYGDPGGVTYAQINLSIKFTDGTSTEFCLANTYAGSYAWVQIPSGKTTATIPLNNKIPSKLCAQLLICPTNGSWAQGSIVETPLV